MIAPIRTDLTKAIYVMRFGWPRWSNTARRKWLAKLLDACLEQIREIEEELSHE